MRKLSKDDLEKLLTLTHLGLYYNLDPMGLEELIHANNVEQSKKQYFFENNAIATAVATGCILGCCNITNDGMENLITPAFEELTNDFYQYPVITEEMFFEEAKAQGNLLD
jgi:hypothetical protein